MILLLLLQLTPFSAARTEIVKENGRSIVHLIGNVVIEDNATRITASEAMFDDTRNLVDLKNDFRIVDKNGEITANYARYHLNKQKAEVSGDVVLISSDKIISADSLKYDGINNFVEMTGNVRIEDKKNKLVAYGDIGWYDLEKEAGNLIKNPRLEILREEKSPIKLRAREFQLLTNSNKFYSFDSVVATIDSITVYADTLLYNLASEDGKVIRPFIYEKENVLRGDKGEFKFKEQQLEVFSVENGWSKYYTTEGSRNIIEGLKISIRFKNGKASKVFVEGEPKGVLTLKKAEDAENQ